MEKGYRLSLDALYHDGYFYTEYDKGGEGHYITIRAEDKELFLDAFAKEWRKRTEELLEEVDVVEENGYLYTDWDEENDDAIGDEE